MSTSNAKWFKKSAPNIGWLTSAKIKIHRIVRLKPKIMDFSPKVMIGVLLAAWRVNSGVLFSEEEAGKTLTSAPVSTKNVVPVDLSATLMRRLTCDLPYNSAASNCWRWRFPADAGMRRVGYIFWHYRRTASDTNSVHLHEL